MTYNSKFGGTQPGWIGERSVPTTLHSGWSSPKFLDLCQQKLRLRYAEDLHAPEARASANV